MNKKNTILSDIGLFYCAAIWGSTFIVTKAALEFVHPISMVGIRFVIAAAILLPWVIRRKNKLRHLKEGFILSFFRSSIKQCKIFFRKIVLICVFFKVFFVIKALFYLRI